MTVNAYIKLTNSNSSLSKNFRVLAEGYDDGTPEKTMSISKTLGGGLDVSQGAIYKSWSPVVRVRHTETDTSYGTIGDLETFFSYNNPNGTPTDKLTLKDHHGTDHTVVMIDDLKKSILSASIEGTNAWYVVQIRLFECP